MASSNDPKDKVREFAEWLSTQPDARELLTHLGTLVCMRCGTWRPPLVELAKGGPMCCYQDVP